ncbi:MAG: hypothetical protein RLZZ165_1323 [Bacteroidota bacterium]
MYTPGFYTQWQTQEEAVFPEIATTVPAFFGLVEDWADSEPVKIGGFPEFEATFGRIPPGTISVELDEKGEPILENGAIVPKRLLHLHLEYYFMNKGGSCYIVPVSELTLEAFLSSLERLVRYPHITLLLPTEAILLGYRDYHAFCQQCLDHCETQKNRFCIFDSGKSMADVQAFQKAMLGRATRRGAAYFPNVIVRNDHFVGKALEEATVTIPASDGYQKSTFNDLGLEEAEKLRAKLRECLLVHYPSAIVAAAYSATDRNRGVWKAPANIWMDGVSGVTPRLTHSQMEQLFQPLEGCTVNMLKAQPGYGTFIWGARTLQGGDGDSAFVNVRRLMDYVEQKLMEVTTFAVFEPNVEMTWVTVKGMCDALMNELWEAGALVGKTREEAWRSEVGLGTTMTQEDILNGRLILEVKVAPVRPAEFILLKIVHQVTAMAVGST